MLIWHVDRMFAAAGDKHGEKKLQRVEKPAIHLPQHQDKDFLFCFASIVHVSFWRGRVLSTEYGIVRADNTVHKRRSTDNLEAAAGI